MGVGGGGGREMGQDSAMVLGCGVRERVGLVTKDTYVD